MITEQELRFGNYLNYNNIAFKVVKIENKFIGLDNDDDFENYADVDEIEPIPLAEEILLNSGFYETSNKDFIGGLFALKQKGDGFYINKETMSYCYFDDEGTIEDIIKINYVHQLQNLYFALTNQELGITL